MLLTSRLEMLFYHTDCDCWRTRSPQSTGGNWGYITTGSSTSPGRVDAIDFQTSGDVLLKGYRLWGVNSGSTTFQVTIRLYEEGILIGERTGSYSTRGSDRTFKVYFLQGISIRAGLSYTATAKIVTNNFTYSLQNGMSSTSCSKVTVTFNNSSKDSNSSSVSEGQIPALIFRSLQCQK